jgi:hypothetical protein
LGKIGGKMILEFPILLLSIGKHKSYVILSLGLKNLDFETPFLNFEQDL